MMIQLMMKLMMKMTMKMIMKLIMMGKVKYPKDLFRISRELRPDQDPLKLVVESKRQTTGPN